MGLDIALSYRQLRMVRPPHLKRKQFKLYERWIHDFLRPLDYTRQQRHRDGALMAGLSPALAIGGDGIRCSGIDINH